MGALYWKRPTAEELAGTGLKPKHYIEPAVTVWEENWAALQLFCRFSTQWRTGPRGPVGLDYAVFQDELRRRDVSSETYTETMDRLRVIEQAALEQIHKD